jgi:hypothetical protein
MSEPPPRWEAAELIAALDPGIAPRLLAAHPSTGRCSSCRLPGPCPIRRLAEAIARAGTPGTAPGGGP